MARQAHLKEALGDRQWRVTPRAAASAAAASASETAAVVPAVRT